MADIIMVATLGESAVSGVALVDSVYILVQTIFAALATGGAVVCSQFIGQKRADMASRTAIQLLYALVFGSVVIMIIGLMFHKTLLTALFGNVDPLVMSNANTYFFYMLIALPSIALYNGCAALFRSQGNSKVSMFTSILINILNIGGNAIMLYGLKSGVEGVAIPTFIARTAAALILFVLLYRRKIIHFPFRNTEKHQASFNALNQISIRGIEKFRIEGNLISKILHIGIPTGLENSIFQVGKILVVTLVASFGTGAIAANAASNTISSFEVLPGHSIGLALLTVVGQCIGAGKPEQAVYYTKKLMILAYISMAALNIPPAYFFENLNRLLRHERRDDTFRLADAHVPRTYGHDFLACFLHTPECATGGERCQIHDGSLSNFHVDSAHRIELLFCNSAWYGGFWHLGCNVSRLDCPFSRVHYPFWTRQVEDQKTYLKVSYFLYDRVILYD